MRIRVDDIVEVIAGEDRVRGKVLRVLRSEGKVVVEGVNRVYRHIRRSQKNLQGGRLSKEMPINSSNCLLFCQVCRRGVRIGKRYDEQGAKERFCKKCSTGLGKLAKPNPKYAKKS